MIWVVIWVVFMLFWLCFGGYTNWNSATPGPFFGNSLIPWICVFILGLFVFGAFSPPPPGAFR